MPFAMALVAIDAGTVLVAIRLVVAPIGAETDRQLADLIGSRR